MGNAIFVKKKSFKPIGFTNIVDLPSTENEYDSLIYNSYLTNNIDGLSISNAIPTSDLIGIKDNTEGSYFDFSVDANLDEAKYVENSRSTAYYRGIYNLMTECNKSKTLCK